MLTRDEIALILQKLSLVTVVPPTREFPFYIVKESSGYSDALAWWRPVGAVADIEVGRLQAKLSIMLEAAGKSLLRG